jgi:O-methyltransferase
MELWMSGTLSRVRQELARYSKRREYSKVYAKFRDYTMISEGDYLANIELAVRYGSTAGAIVECGTWRGGMIAGVASALGAQRNYFLFDSFEGLPPAKDLDGEAAKQWQQDVDSPGYYDNCSASIDDAKTAMAMAGINNPEIIKGWFENTLENLSIDQGISVLRLDADWYESTMTILTNLFDQVNSGGVLIIDDYYAWEGCAKAVHDFLSQRKCKERIFEHKGICYIVKATAD